MRDEKFARGGTTCQASSTLGYAQVNGQDATGKAEGEIALQPGLQPDTTCCVGFSNSSASRTTTASLPWQCDILRAFRAGAAEQFAEAHLGCLDQAQ